MNQGTEEFLINAEKVCLSIAGRQVLDHVDFSIRRGEIVTLIGPNGSGKTSFVRVLLGLLRPDGGRLAQKAGLRIAYMPQKIHIDDVLPLSVKRFLQLACKVPDKEIQQVLDRVGANSLMHTAIQNVSGGEFQRILLARCLLRRPDVLVLDEPAQGVDINGQQQLYQLITEIRNEYGCAVLMVSHDLHLVMANTDYVMCLNTHICCTGHPEDVSKHPEYLKLFGSSMDGLAVYTHKHDHSHDIHGDIIQCDEHEHHG